MKLIMILYLAFILVIVANIHPANAFAEEFCHPLLNGGQTDRQYCVTPAPGQPTATPSPVPQVTAPPKTKGGQTVYPTPKTKSTPSTGPEEWALPAVFLIGGMGFWLRKKTKLT